MKNILVGFAFFISTGLFSEAFAQVETQGSNNPPVLRGHLANVSEINMALPDVMTNPDQVSAQNPLQNPRSTITSGVLYATVVYSSICQPPVSFIVIENPEPYSYSVIEAHAPVPAGHMSCQAINRVEARIMVAQFYGEQPRTEVIKVKLAWLIGCRR